MWKCQPNKFPNLFFGRGILSQKLGHLETPLQALGLLQQVSGSHSPYKRHLETEIT